MPKGRRGKLFVLDGIDGSGKATQLQMLATWLSEHNIRVRTIDFPRYYDNFFGALVGECQRGDCGDFVALHPKVASVLYAADRFETKSMIEDWLSDGYVVLTDRYVSSNQIHQGGKIRDPKKRSAFLAWLARMEYEVFGIPRPDGVVFLDAPPEVSRKLLANKDQRSKKKYLRGRRDVTENDAAYLTNSRKSARWILRHEPGWHMVSCVTRGQLRTREEIHEDVRTTVWSLL